MADEFLFRCPHCSQWLVVDKTYNGQNIQCTHCHKEALAQDATSEQASTDKPATEGLGEQPAKTASKAGGGLAGFFGGIAACIIAFTTLLGVIKAQLPQVSDMIQILLNSKQKVVWYGSYRDYSALSNTVVQAKETLQLASYGNYLLGEASETQTYGTSNSSSWKVKGRTYDSGAEIFLEYENKPDSGLGRGYYILKRGDDANIYFGQWFGLDSHLQQTVCFPYVLSKYLTWPTNSSISKHLQGPGLINGDVTK